MSGNHKYIERTGTPGKYKYRYAVLNRPVSFATVPKGYSNVEPHASYKHGVVVYDKPLSSEEITSYELRPFLSDEETKARVEKVVSDLKEYENEYKELIEDDPATARTMIRQALGQEGDAHFDYELATDDVIKKFLAKKSFLLETNMEKLTLSIGADKTEIDLKKRKASVTKGIPRSTMSTLKPVQPQRVKVKLRGGLDFGKTGTVTHHTPEGHHVVAFKDGSYGTYHPQHLKVLSKGIMSQARTFAEKVSEAASPMTPKKTKEMGPKGKWKPISKAVGMGARVQISHGSGIDSGKIGTIVPHPTSFESQKKLSPGMYKPHDPSRNHWIKLDSGGHTSMPKNRVTLSKADNSPDIDVDAGRMGVADYGGRTSMRVQPNDKCNGCSHYNNNEVACKEGLVPSVCGDGTYPEIGYAPLSPNRIAAKNWMQLHRDRVVTSTQAPDQGYAAGEVPFRVEVLGDSALTLSERMDLVKAAVQDPAAVVGHIWFHRKKEKGKPPKAWWDKMMGKIQSRKSFEHPTVMKAIEEMTGVEIHPQPQVSFQKPRMNLDEFADLMGTTVDVVRSIAFKLGDKHEFLQFIKSKLPDIMMAHGLDETGINQLYKAATKVVKGLSTTEWEMWKGVNFEEATSDETLARAIAEHGLLDRNAAMHGGILAPAMPMTSEMPSPEPIQQPQQDPIMTGFVGGNLHLADSYSNRR